MVSRSQPWRAIKTRGFTGSVRVFMECATRKKKDKESPEAAQPPCRRTPSDRPISSRIKWGQGFVANVAVLLGIVAGAVLAAAIGLMHFEKVATAHWVDIVLPFHFGVPEFHPIPIITMCIVMVVVMIESLGMFLALGEITGKSIDQASLTRGLRSDGVGTILGGIFNTFPYTSFSQNVGLVGVTGVISRWITVTGGVLMLVLGLLPKMSALVEAVPQVVLVPRVVDIAGFGLDRPSRIESPTDRRYHRRMDDVRY